MVSLNAYTRFGEEWKGVGKCDRTKGCEGRAVNWGELARPSFWFFSASSGLKDKGVPFLQVWGASLT